MAKERSPRNRQTVTDGGDLRKYRTELPNLIDDIGLTPIAFRLYGHYKRRAGANGGECTAGLRAIARHCGMSVNTVRKARDELKTYHLIETRQVPDARGVHEYVSINDVWWQNFHMYSPNGELRNAGVSNSDTRGVLINEQGVSPGDTGGVSRVDTEERTKDQEVTKEERKTPQRGTRLPDDFTITESMKEWAAEYVPHVSLATALAEFTDYWRGVPGQRGTKLDWEATWRNRMRELEARAPRNGNGFQSASKVGATMRAVENVKARHAN